MDFLTKINVPSHTIDYLYTEDHIYLDLQTDTINNYYILQALENPKQSALVRHVGEGKVVICKSNIHFQGIYSKDSRQTVFMDSLSDPDILVSVALGKAGTGKTTLALAYALDQAFTNGKKIHMTKPTSMVGRSKAFGPVPGDIKDKYAPFLASYKSVLKDITNKEAESYWSLMEDKNVINYTPIELVRGCTFKNTTFILDEAQNTDWHELNTLMSRMGEGTELIILGDIYQVDTRMARDNTGLARLVRSQSFNKSKLSSVIELTAQHRSPITALAAEVDEEFRNKKENS